MKKFLLNFFISAIDNFFSFGSIKAYCPFASIVMMVFIRTSSEIETQLIMGYLLV